MTTRLEWPDLKVLKGGALLLPSISPLSLVQSIRHLVTWLLDGLQALSCPESGIHCLKTADPPSTFQKGTNLATGWSAYTIFSRPIYGAAPTWFTECDLAPSTARDDLCRPAYPLQSLHAGALVAEPRGQERDFAGRSEPAEDPGAAQLAAEPDLWVDQRALPHPPGKFRELRGFGFWVSGFGFRGFWRVTVPRIEAAPEFMANIRRVWVS